MQVPLRYLNLQVLDHIRHRGKIMAHFAKLDSDNKVLEIYVVTNEVILDEYGIEQEQLGIDFLNNLSGIGWELQEGESWKQTSYNATFRKNYASKGHTYDSTRDAFIGPQPYPSWILNEDTCQWEPPVPEPVYEEGILYEWNEDTTTWEKV